MIFGVKTAVVRHFKCGVSPLIVENGGGEFVAARHINILRIDKQAMLSPSHHLPLLSIDAALLLPCLFPPTVRVEGNARQWNVLSEFALLRLTNSLLVVPLPHDLVHIHLLILGQ